MNIPVSVDCDNPQMIEYPAECPHCFNKEQKVLSSNVATYGSGDANNKKAYKMWRLRILTYCEKCKKSTPYRLAGYVIENAKKVDA